MAFCSACRASRACTTAANGGKPATRGAHDDYDLRPEFTEPAPNELTDYIHTLIEARAGSCALNYGAYRNVVIFNKQLLFERAVDADGDAPAERVLVAVYAVVEPFTLQAGELNGTFIDLLNEDAEPIELTGALELKPFEGALPPPGITGSL